MRSTWCWCGFAVCLALAVPPARAQYPYPGPPPGMYGPSYPPALGGQYGMPAPPMYRAAYPPANPAVMARPQAAPNSPAPMITGFLTVAAPAPNCPTPPLPAPAAPAPAAPAQPAPAAPARPENAAPPVPPASSEDAFAQAPEAGTEAPASYVPNMIGDLTGYTYVSRGNAHLPVTAFGALKIAENESPRPQTRVFATYNFFNNVDGSLNTAPVPAFDLHREVVGGEYALLDGAASIGIRVPFSQLAGDTSIKHEEIGDLSIIGKYVLINDCKNGILVSGGLEITVPTGDDAVTITGAKVDPLLLQPFAGFIFDFDRFYIHGFSSVVVPMDLRLQTVLLEDIGVGYWLYRCNGDKLLTGIVPTVEGHANIPVSNRGIHQVPLGFTDEGVVTGGVHFIFCRRATLTGAVSIPLTGPQPYDIEATAQLNFRF